jgi:hypothetical protein
MRQTRLWMRRRESDGRTQYTLRGTLPESMPEAALHQLLSLLLYWSGERLRVVLRADDPAWWLEPWVDALGTIPERHLDVQFRHGPEDDHAE